MLRDGYVTKEQLEDVLQTQHDSPQQRISGWRLGELLVERGVMTQGQVAQLVAEQYELPFMDLDESQIDRSVVSLLPSEMVDRFSALPIETLADGSLVLAVSDPATVLFSDELRRTLGRPLRFMVVAPDAMESAVSAVRGEPAPEQPSLSVAAWPSGAPSFDFLGNETSEPGELAADPVTANGSAPETTTSNPPLGTLLVRDGLLTEDELEAALAEQRLSDGKRLGEILVERGTLTRADVARVVAEQYELPFVDLSSFELDHRVGGLLPHDIARRYSALPLDFLADGSLRVAIADPTKVLSPEEILAALGARLSFTVADPDLVEAAIEEQAEVESATASSWATLAPVGPPVSGAHEDTHVDASDLIIIPAAEAERVEVEALERRDHDQPEADVDGTTFTTSEAAPEPAIVAAPDLEPEAEHLVTETAQTAEDATQDDAAPLAVAAPAPKQRKRRRLFGRKKRHHEDEPTTEAAVEPTTGDALDDGVGEAITGLLLAGEAAAADDSTIGEASPHATEQAAVLRLWITGDDPTAAAPAAESETETQLPDGEWEHAESSAQPVWLDPVDAEPTGSELVVVEHDEAFAGDAVDELFVPEETPAAEAESELAHEVEEHEVEEHEVEELGDPETLGEHDPELVSESFATEPGPTTDTQVEYTGLPEAVEDVLLQDQLETAEPWNIFAPASPAAELEAPGEDVDAPPAELHDESETALELAEDTHDPPDSETPLGEVASVDFESLTPGEELLEPEPDEETSAEHQHEEVRQDAVVTAPEHETAFVETSGEAPEDVQAELEDDVAGDEPETAVQMETAQPSWLSWEPAVGSADPWPAPGPEDESTAAATAEPELTDDVAAELAVEPLADEPSDEAWLAEIEPDAPDADAAPWELEQADAHLAEVEPFPFAHEEPDVPDEQQIVEPPALAVVADMSTLEPSEEEHGVLTVGHDTVGEPVALEVVASHPEQGTLAPLVERATALGASTVHFSAQQDGVVVRARIDGVLRKLDTVTGQARYELDRELGLAAQSGSYAGGGVTALPTPHGDTVTIRFRPTGGVATLETLSLDPADREALERALRHPFGLVLVAGPSGSGKAATLSAALDELASGDRAVMTIEDPILHVVPGVDQVAVDPNAGRGYASGLRTLLGADPDAILVGELADEETARLALDAATGHLVVTTVLAQTAVGALDRLALLGVDADLVASTLSLVVAQRLVRQLCDHCREGYYATAADTIALRRPEDEIGRRLLARGTGCAECGDTGFSGTIGMFEVLVPNDEVRDLVAGNAPAAEVERAARIAGKRTLADDAVRLCLEGLTTVSEVQRVLGRALL